MTVRELITLLLELDTYGYGNLPVVVQDGLDPSDPVECTCVAQEDNGRPFITEDDGVQRGPHIMLS